MLLCPKQVNYSKIIEQKTLSPRNLSKIDIVNQDKVPLQDFLSPISPFTTGEEPGSSAYVLKSDILFIRNSCIDSWNYSNQTSKEISLNPRYTYSYDLKLEDILLCKDANIGDTCIFIPEKNYQYVFSSGIVKLNFKDQLEKFYCFAFLRD